MVLILLFQQRPGSTFPRLAIPSSVENPDAISAPGNDIIWQRYQWRFLDATGWGTQQEKKG
jgi:hypothetical protein